MSKECRGCGVRYYPDELREHLLHCPVLTRDNRIAELEAELQNPSGGWYCTDCGSADALVSITFRIAELEAERDMAYASNRELRLLLREARHHVMFERTQTQLRPAGLGWRGVPRGRAAKEEA